MIEKIVHISDLHIRTYQYHDIYKEQFTNLLDDVAEQLSGIDYNKIRVVLTGDIAHQKINISNEQLMLTSWFLTELTKLGKLIIIPGNHDFLENNMERMDSITPIVELLNNDKITYYKDFGKYTDENIDWVVYSLYQHNQRPNFVKDEKQHTIGLFHGPIEGLVTDLGFTFEDGYSRLNFADLDIVLCGDIHKRSVFTIPSGGKGIMVGSAIQQNYGESIKHHGYGIYDVPTNDYTFHDIKNESPFLFFEISDINDIENEKEILLNLG